MENFTNQQKKRVIYSLYVHFPFCRHKCNYCDFYKNVPQTDDEISQFENLLKDSFDRHEALRIEHGYEWGNLETLYIGGGTPSLWGERGAKYLQKLLSEQKIILADDCEFTLEVNPGSWEKSDLLAWESCGANRFSLGIQSLNEDFIRILDRVHDLNDVYNTLEYFNQNRLGFSVDFMLGLPYSKEKNRDVIKELEEILTFGPEHISLYILTVKEGYKYYAQLPDEEWIEEEFLKVSAFLEKNGFAHYEVSNFALPGKHSRHNLNYWESRTVAALGPSATGLLREAGIRYKWNTNKSVFDIEELGASDLKLESLYMLLRTNKGVQIDQFFAPNELNLVLDKWSRNGLATLHGNQLKLTTKGYLLMDSLMDDIFLHTKSL